MNAHQPGLFQTDAAAVDDRVRQAIQAGAVVAFSLSGGKDSTVAAFQANRLLDELGHPHERRIAIHADLGRAEWKSTPAMVEAVAARLQLELMVVRHRTHDMVSRWEARFTEGKRRYAALEVFNLIGPWSSASLRFCTAELKQQVISPALQRRFPGETIISVVGIRREESTGRKNAPVSKDEPRWGKLDGTRLLTWHPVVEWTAAQVFAAHQQHGLPLHEAYTVFGSSRVSCAFCIMQSLPDQRAATRSEGNRELLHHLVALEARSTFSFQPDRWLADAAPELLPASLQADVAAAKLLAVERRELEAALPRGLRYVKGWPTREPTTGEAAQVVSARRTILGRHGLPETYPTADSVVGRFRELMAANAAKEAA